MLAFIVLQSVISCSVWFAVIGEIRDHKAGTKTLIKKKKSHLLVILFKSPFQELGRRKFQLNVPFTCQFIRLQDCETPCANVWRCQKNCTGTARTGLT